VSSGFFPAVFWLSTCVPYSFVYFCGGIVFCCSLIRSSTYPWNFFTASLNLSSVMRLDASILASSLASTVFASYGSGIPFCALVLALVIRCSFSFIYSCRLVIVYSIWAILFSIVVYFPSSVVFLSANSFALSMRALCSASSRAMPSISVWCVACSLL
jgi:hypothetical protein